MRVLTAEMIEGNVRHESIDDRDDRRVTSM